MATLDDFDGDYDEEDYMYMEETYIAADDLAEHAVASPVPYDGDDDFDPDHWRYDYWADIEYDSDGDAVRSRRADAAEARRKRKRFEATKDASSKRRKVEPGIAYATDDSPAVLLVYKRVDETLKSVDPKIDLATLKPWALMEDWQTVLANAPEFPAKDAVAKLPTVSDEAEEEEEELTAAQDDEEMWEEESEHEEGVGAGGLDPEVLKMALRKQMAAAGLTGIDEETLMRFATRMLTGEGESDDIAGELAEELLDQEDGEEEGGEGGGITEWVSKQVQSSKTPAEHLPLTRVDSNSTTAPPQPPTPASTASSSVENISPETKARSLKRKAALGDEGSSPKRTPRSQPPNPASSNIQGKKRKAEGDSEPLQVKRPARSFDTPTAASKGRSVSSTILPAKGARKGRKG